MINSCCTMWEENVSAAARSIHGDTATTKAIHPAQNDVVSAVRTRARPSRKRRDPTKYRIAAVANAASVAISHADEPRATGV
jgi:hypothetical protein